MTGRSEGARPEPTARGEADGEALAGLVARVAGARDRRAFVRLFEHFAPRLKSFYLRQGVPHAAAEDLVQECMVALWNRAGDYEPGRAAVSTWLFTIARNLGIDRIRRERRFDPDVPAEDALLAAGAGADGHDGSAPEAALESRRRETAVRAALTVLPEDQRRVVDLHYGEWMTTAEIARRESLPQGTVKSRLRLALARLRTELEAV